MDVETREKLPTDYYLSTLRFFHHKELTINPDPSNTIKQRTLINLWNYHHFTDSMVYVQINNPQYKDDILVQAYPEPCSDTRMTCRWPEDSIHFAEKSEIHNIIITDGISVILIPAIQQEIQRDRFSIDLPDKAYVLGERKSRRYICLDARADLVQNDLRLKGQLIDFSPRAFRVKIIPCITATSHLLKSDCPSTINLYRNEMMVFSESCRCIRQTSGQSDQEIVFAPLSDQISRFLKKKNRNPRVQIKPLPNVTFQHPFFKKRIQLDVQDISTSGFAVYLSEDEDVLLTGMIVSELSINFAGALKLKCKAQIMYRREETKGKICYGFVLLDMDIGTYNRLSHILMNVIDSNTHISVEVDTDRLWEFLFESGFIYPKKYNSIQLFRERLKDTYQNLYHDNPEIAVQITYQKNGKIFGHASMVKSYERTWMIHHLAARSMKNNRIGIILLKQIVRYFDGLYRLPSVRMDHMMFYFRPENRFPDYFFGDFARHLNNPQACSLDLFSYLNYKTTSVWQPLPEEWLLEPCTDSDISVLKSFYRKVSGGLLLDVLRMDKNDQGIESLSQLYARNGFIRSFKSYSLKQNEILKAVLVVNQSDPGLNLSDLLNGIKILITDESGLSWENLSAAICQLTGFYQIEKIPILIYPSAYPESRGVPFEKHYYLWILDVRYGREYGEYMMGNRKEN